MKLTNKAVIEALDGLPPAKVHCSVLAEEAIKAAIADYYHRQGIEMEVPAATDTARAATFTKPKRAAALGKARKRAARRRLHEA